MRKLSSLLVFASLLLMGSPFIVAGALIVVGWYIGIKVRQWWAVRRFRRTWQPRGKDLLIVYSDSPHWQLFVEEQWLPRWGHRAVVLNWSDRREWLGNRSAEVALFRAFAGSRDFNPLGIVVPEQGPVTVVRFWRAFRDFKHGKDHSLRRAESVLERALTNRGRQWRLDS